PIIPGAAKPVQDGLIEALQTDGFPEAGNIVRGRRQQICREIGAQQADRACQRRGSAAVHAKDEHATAGRSASQARAWGRIKLTWVSRYTRPAPDHRLDPPSLPTAPLTPRENANHDRWCAVRDTRSLWCAGASASIAGNSRVGEFFRCRARARARQPLVGGSTAAPAP